jgi:hypothetical protein
MSALWEGQLRHAKSDELTCNDWGYIRDESGTLIACVKYQLDEADLEAHRANKTDPAQARVDFIVAAVNEAIKKGCKLASDIPRAAHSISKSCDACASQEGRHYCLLHSRIMKNMDATRCDDWSRRDDNTKGQTTP